MKFTRILLLLIFPFYFLSCGTQNQIPFYLQNVSDSSGRGDVKIPELKIQKGDLLSIQIYSMSTLPEVDQVYNLPGGASGSAVAGVGQASTGGFLVDNNGNIEHFRKELGILHAEGLTKHELAAEIKKRLTEPVELLKDPTVTIRYLNFHIIVLGEVGQQGPVNVPGERVTILEAIGLAGGIPRHGKKDNIKVVRENNGKRETGYIDLTNSNLFESPYYNLMQNDVVIVEPSKRQLRDEDQQRAIQKVSMGLTLVAAAATLSNIFIRN